MRYLTDPTHYPISRTTSLDSTLNPSDLTLLPHPHKGKTTPFAGTFQHITLQQKNHTVAGTIHPYYPIPGRTTPFAGTIHPYYPIPGRTTPFVSTLIPITQPITPSAEEPHLLTVP